MNSVFKSRSIGSFTTAFAAIFMSAPALAQSSDAQTAWVHPSSFGASYGKAEAILGGAPSRLAAILAEQKGLAAPTTLPPRQSLLPASLSIKPPTYAILRGARRYSPGAVSGRPDVFGSVALSVGRTPLDQRWRNVARQRVGGAAARYAAALREREAVDQVEAVNRYVNGRVQFVDDSRQYGREDMWATAAETLRRGRGDCEDYAIAKLQLLRAAGVADSDLYLVIAKDLIRRADHALLVVRAGGRMLVLDNGTNRILDADDISDYRPVLTFSANGAWTHGYRRPTPIAPMTMASATVAALTPSGSAILAD